MGRHHDPAMLSMRSHRHIRAVVEGAHQLTFRAAEVLIGRQVQAALDLRSIQHAVVFAAHHITEARQIGKDGSGTILPIQPQHDPLLWQVMSLPVELDCSHRPAQFFPKLSVARVGKRAEPLRGMRLRDGRAGTDDLPTLAPSVAGRTHLSQPPLGCRQFRRLWQGTLAGGLARAIDVEDHSLAACSVNQPAGLPLFAQRARQPIFKKEHSQGFNRRWGEAGQKATERRAAGQLLPVEQGHEWFGKRSQPFIEGFKGTFATDRVAEEDRQKVDHLVVPKAPPRKAHVLTDGGQDALFP